MSKTGNGRLRATAVEMAWSLLRYRPDSELSQWYEDCFACGSRRVRKIGTVALARKLLIALWRYLEEGEISKGARLKPLKV
jgi:transposase